MDAAFLEEKSSATPFFIALTVKCTCWFHPCQYHQWKCTSASDVQVPHLRAHGFGGHMPDQNVFNGWFGCDSACKMEWYDSKYPGIKHLFGNVNVERSWATANTPMQRRSCHFCCVTSATQIVLNVCPFRRVECLLMNWAWWPDRRTKGPTLSTRYVYQIETLSSQDGIVLTNQNATYRHNYNPWENKQVQKVADAYEAHEGNVQATCCSTTCSHQCR